MMQMASRHNVKKRFGIYCLLIIEKSVINMIFFLRVGVKKRGPSSEFANLPQKLLFSHETKADLFH